MTYYEAYSQCKNINELFDMVDNDRAFAQDDQDEMNCVMDAALRVIRKRCEYINNGCNMEFK